MLIKVTWVCIDLLKELPDVQPILYDYSRKWKQTVFQYEVFYFPVFIVFSPLPTNSLLRTVHNVSGKRGGSVWKMLTKADKGGQIAPYNCTTTPSHTLLACHECKDVLMLRLLNIHWHFSKFKMKLEGAARYAGLLLAPAEGFLYYFGPILVIFGDQ